MIETEMSKSDIQARLAVMRAKAATSDTDLIRGQISGVASATEIGILNPAAAGEMLRRGTVRPPETWEQELPDVPEPFIAPSADDPVGPAKKWRFVRPLWAAAEQWVEYIRNTDERWMLGLKEIDIMTRGHGRGELTYLTGFSHSGKTQVFLTAMLHNRTKPTVLFSFDETSEQVLAKLVGMHLRMDGEILESKVKDGDPQTLKLIHELARTRFSNLMVIDECLSLSDMTLAVQEAGNFFGRQVEAVGIDYLELLRCDETEIEKKSVKLKMWTKDIDLPVMCIHQGSRGNAGKGQELGMQSMKYGGESEAFMVLGVRRKRDLPDFAGGADYDTVSVSVLKNKRPPSKKGERDFYLDPQNGSILSLDAPRTLRTVEQMAAPR